MKHQRCALFFCSFRDKNRPHATEKKMGSVTWTKYLGVKRHMYTWDLKPVAV